MAHGTPDWAQYAAKSTVYGEIDTSELAVRLGSIVSYDRRGDVVWLDDFNSGLAEWELESWGLGKEIAISAVTARSAGFSCKLTAGSDDLHAATIRHILPFPVLSKLGFEFSFTYSNPFKFLELGCYLYFSTYALVALIKYTPETMKLQYQEDAIAWRDIATNVQFLTSDRLFNTMKLVVDAEAETFVRLLVNDAAYPLADIPIYKTFFGWIPRGSMDIYLEGRALENDIMYIDDVIITQNEP
ncbi:MAG: hypothetical protein GH156_00560 [Dehalococcoidia bacterium]|nr:hypothetical protein [Dehalococcoidia bacterium]